MSDTVYSSNVVTFNGNTPAVGSNETTPGVLRMVHMTDTSMSTNIAAIGGTAPATGLNENTSGVLKVAMITSVNSSVNVTSFNGNAPATGLNETTSGVLRVVQMTDATSSVNIVSSITQNTNMVGGGNDSIFTFMARTTNPTAVADGADVRGITDKLGRQLSRPIQVRDLIKTAYVALSTGTETTLLTATAATFADLIMITATNNSTAATQLDIRATSAGNIIHTMYLPAATGPVGFSPSIPWPQDSTGNSWTIDMPDQTGTTVYVSALFSQEI